MNLLINGKVAVEIKIDSFSGNGGHVLLAFIKGVSQEAKDFHSEVPERIRNFFPAIMDNFNDIREDEEPQIRLLECSPLEFVDILRLLGYGVKQVL